jgi:hypothetical protein
MVFAGGEGGRPSRCDGLRLGVRRGVEGAFDDDNVTGVRLKVSFCIKTTE